jgi:cyclophilin family peptidyl-prolyl cis-trans isomerase
VWPKIEAIGIAANAHNVDDRRVAKISGQHGGKSVQPLRKSIFASFILIPVLALVGCQKSGDSTPPAAAITAPGGEKPESVAAPATEVTPVKSDQESQHPSFEFETTQGKFTVSLDAEKAPATVENFRKYVARGQYNQTIFHEVSKTGVQIVLGGGYTADLKEKPTLTPIRNEADNGLKNRRATIAMARSPDIEDSASAQFFFNIADNDILDFKARTAKDYGYCVFGTVTAGMDVLDRIAQTPVHQVKDFPNLPMETITIKSIRQLK